MEDGLSITWRAAVAGMEAGMALCAALNLAYFLHRAVSVEPLSRRAAAFVLALISFGAMVESGFVILALGDSAGDSVFGSAGWLPRAAGDLRRDGVYFGACPEGDFRAVRGGMA